MNKEKKEIKEKKLKLKFRGKKRSKRGLVSMILSILSVLGFVTAVVMSAMKRGQGEEIIGYIGILCLLATLIGFILGIRCLRKEHDILYFHPIFGLSVNSVMMITFLVLFLNGLFV